MRARDALAHEIGYKVTTNFSNTQVFRHKTCVFFDFYSRMENMSPIRGTI